MAFARWSRTTQGATIGSQFDKDVGACTVHKFVPLALMYYRETTLRIEGARLSSLLLPPSSRLLKGWKPFIISTAFLLFCFSFSLPATFYCVMKLYTSIFWLHLSSLFPLYYSNITINNGCGVGVVCWCSICGWHVYNGVGWLEY